MYNRYIRNDQGTYTRIPEEEPRHTQGGTSPSGQPEHPPSGGGQQPPHWDSAPPPRPDPPPSGENGPDSLSSLLRHLLDQFHLSSVDSGDLLLLAILFFLFRLLGCEAALLKERSPSCGSGMVYDGTFTGVLTAGEGVTAELLRAQGIPVYGESRVAELADPI